MYQQHDLLSAIHYVLSELDELPTDGDPDADPVREDLEREFAHLRLQLGNA